MKKIILVYGSICGVVVICAITAGLVIGEGEGPWSSQWLGYLIMFVALSAIFFGIKQYRDTELGGVITFGKAFLLGLGISVVAAVAYVVCWEIYLAMTDYAFIDNYIQGIIEAEKEAGASEENLQLLVESMNAMKETYDNPLFRLPITFLEIFPVGLLISLVSAALLRKSDVLPAQA